MLYSQPVCERGQHPPPCLYVCGNERQPTPAVVTSPAHAHLSCHPLRALTAWESLGFALGAPHSSAAHTHGVCVVHALRRLIVSSSSSPGPSGPTGRFTRLGDGAGPPGSGWRRGQRILGKSAVAHSEDATRCSGLDVSVSNSPGGASARRTRDARRQCISGHKPIAVVASVKLPSMRLCCLPSAAAVMEDHFRLKVTRPKATAPERSVCER